MAERPAGISQPSIGQKWKRGPQLLADETQPRDPVMGGFRYRVLHVEMEDRNCAAGVFLGQPLQRALHNARSTIAYRAVANEIDIRMVLIGRPKPLEIV